MTMQATAQSSHVLTSRLGDTHRAELLKFRMPIETVNISRENYREDITRKDIGSERGVYDRLALDIEPEFHVLPFRCAPIQLWEGEVLEVDYKASVMSVLLSAKMGSLTDHTAEIGLEWVHEQDKDLVIPGGVFYWTIFKETTRGSIRNAEELRFRRLPSWTKEQVRRIYARANDTLKRGRFKRDAV